MMCMYSSKLSSVVFVASHMCRNNLGASLLLLIFHPGVDALIFICQLNEIMFAKFKCLYTIDMKTVYMCP